MRWTSLMLAPDINVLVYAHREDLPEHDACRRWLEQVVDAHAAYGIQNSVPATMRASR